ncbi:hypothetical protein, conserved [Eimeria tenella]|uniref:Uncharacterized protein n=1 Tax=Eimeria tenella TaxID=5802 RepID=U6KSK0_EIMTE|nr:hypothetical protein, conserved [Eimeria tenella]CDJ41097.1 hypothetical protein, conserved [Eimeria tenella]|eukprot:XP_013231847.1 hypothetical protein, conserved [Eimeria tenella]
MSLSRVPLRNTLPKSILPLSVIAQDVYIASRGESRRLPAKNGWQPRARVAFSVYDIAGATQHHIQRRKRIPDRDNASSSINLTVNQRRCVFTAASHTVPGAASPAPVARNLAPVADNPVPVANNPVSVSGNPVSASDNPTTANESQSPQALPQRLTAREEFMEALEIFKEKADSGSIYLLESRLEMAFAGHADATAKLSIIRQLTRDLELLNREKTSLSMFRHQTPKEIRSEYTQMMLTGLFTGLAAAIHPVFFIGSIYGLVRMRRTKRAEVDRDAGTKKMDEINQIVKEKRALLNVQIEALSQIDILPAVVSGVQIAANIVQRNEVKLDLLQSTALNNVLRFCPPIQPGRMKMAVIPVGLQKDA